MKPVVLAGGTGSRLWPKSRAALPKQFLSLTSNSTMLQDTVTRLNGTNAEPPVFIIRAGGAKHCASDSTCGITCHKNWE